MIEDVGAVEECAQAIKAYLAPLNALPVAPPVLQPAGLYLELIGETIRRRAVLTSNDALCLRPDMTIPAARLALSLPHWSGEGFALIYDGRVFRRLSGEAQPVEPRQIGVEWYAPLAHSGRRDEGMLLAALGACQAAGVEGRLVLGCAALFKALIGACGFPPALSRALLRAHRVQDALTAAKAGHPPLAGGQGALAAILAQTSPDQANALVEEILVLAGVAQLGGRPMQEVAERLRAKAALANEPPINRAVLEKLEGILAIEGEPMAAFDALRRLAGALPAPGAALARLEALAHLWAGAIAAGLKPSAAVFRAGFDRRLEYYDGLVFDLVGARGAALGGGGRYDQVLPALAQAEARQEQLVAAWGAAGFSLYPAALAMERRP